MTLITYSNYPLEVLYHIQAAFSANFNPPYTFDYKATGLFLSLQIYEQFCVKGWFGCNLLLASATIPVEEPQHGAQICSC